MTSNSKQFTQEQIEAKGREMAQRPEIRAARRLEYVFFGLCVVLLVFGTMALRLLFRSI